VAAAVDGKRRGLVDHWLHPIREVAHDHKAELVTYADERERLRRAAEITESCCG
jgi:carbonic anhydrase